MIRRSLRNIDFSCLICRVSRLGIGVDAIGFALQGGSHAQSTSLFSFSDLWHITHRCHRKSFLLKFAKDRRRWIHWLFVTRTRFGLQVLNYNVISNHLHLLVEDQGQGEMAQFWTASILNRLCARQSWRNIGGESHLLDKD